MSLRVKFALLLFALACPTLSAQTVPLGGADINMVLAKVDGEQLVIIKTEKYSCIYPVLGKDGTIKSVTVPEEQTTTVSRSLKYLKATDPANKPIPMADVKRLLSKPGPVFVLSKPMDAAFKAKFKPGSILLEYAEPEADAPKPDKK